MVKTRNKPKPGKVRSQRASAGNTPTMEWVSRYYRPIKHPVTLRLDADVIDWFKKLGRGYQTRINRALRDLMLSEQKRAK
jgi:uncharacterized protein (DUF4415 family)